MFKNELVWIWLPGPMLVWVVYPIIFFGYVFLAVGRRNRRRPMMRKEEELFPYKVNRINGQRN